MIQQLKDIIARYEAIAERMNDPSVASDYELYLKLSREIREIEPVALKYRELSAVEQSIRDMEELLLIESDREMRTLFSDELRLEKERAEVLNREITALLLPKDPNDSRNVVVEIRAGAGGEEAALFAGSLYRMYAMFAADAGFRLEPVSANPTELGGYREISFTVEGSGAYSRLKYESGVHRVQRVPETETQGRIHTSTVTVAVLPEAEDVEIEINPNDLEITTMKSSGAGGQHINKTESAIRILHKPSGIVVECQEERSQFKNRDKAMCLLRTKLLHQKQEERDSRISADRRSQVGTGERCEKIRTYNFPQSRMTDHRIGFTSYSLESFLNGRIDELINALAAADTAEKLKESSQS